MELLETGGDYWQLREPRRVYYYLLAHPNQYTKRHYKIYIRHCNFPGPYAAVSIDSAEGYTLAEKIRTRELDPGVFADWLDENRDCWECSGDARIMFRILRQGWNSQENI